MNIDLPIEIWDRIITYLQYINKPFNIEKHRIIYNERARDILALSVCINHRFNRALKRCHELMFWACLDDIENIERITHSMIDSTDVILEEFTEIRLVGADLYETAEKKEDINIDGILNTCYEYKWRKAILIDIAYNLGEPFHPDHERWINWDGKTNGKVRIEARVSLLLEKFKHHGSQVRHIKIGHRMIGQNYATNLYMRHERERDELGIEFDLEEIFDLEESD